MEGKSAEEVIEKMDEKAKIREEADKKAREEKQQKDLEAVKIEDQKVKILREKALAAFNGVDSTKTNEKSVVEQETDVLKNDEKTETKTEKVEQSNDEKVSTIIEGDATSIKPNKKTTKKSTESKKATDKTNKE